MSKARVIQPGELFYCTDRMEPLDGLASSMAAAAKDRLPVWFFVSLMLPGGTVAGAAGSGGWGMKRVPRPGDLFWISGLDMSEAMSRAIAFDVPVWTMVGCRTEGSFGGRPRSVGLDHEGATDLFAIGPDHGGAREIIPPEDYHLFDGYAEKLIEAARCSV